MSSNFRTASFKNNLSLLPIDNNRLTFQTEGAALAASSLKSNYIKNENICPKAGEHYTHICKKL